MRDRLLALTAALVLAALAATVVILVLEAQQRGIDAREKLRLEQIEAEASSMESILQTTMATQAQTTGSPGYFSLRTGDPDDAAKLAPTTPQARTGQVLVDRDGVVVNGSLLRDPELIGRRIDREGLDAVLAGEISWMPIDEGLTTTFPAIALGVPARDAAGTVIGASFSETEVAPESMFNLFVPEASGDTATIAFVDRNGRVVGSRNSAVLGETLEAPVLEDFEPGFRRAAGKVAAIAPVPSAEWSLVFLQDVGEFQGDLTGPLQTALLIFLGVVAVVGVFTVVALTRRLQAAREEQRRLEAISAAREEFTSIVSHELRTPVAGVLGFLQTTVDHWTTMSDEDRRRSVARAFSNARSLQTLTSDVLDSASIDARTLTYRFDSIDIAECVREAVATLRETIPGRTLDTDVPEDPVLVRADPVRVRQVVGNLLDNAVKSSPPDAPIVVGVRIDGRFAEVSVRDRGPGIAEDERERLFDKFTRGRSGIVRGTGLGLYISRHIVEAHGGTISASSISGEPGALLSFTLPLAVRS